MRSALAGVFAGPLCLPCPVLSSAWGGALGPLQPPTYRLYNCQRCSVQTRICQRCDHGQIYCGGAVCAYSPPRVRAPGRRTLSAHASRGVMPRRPTTRLARATPSGDASGIAKRRALPEAYRTIRSAHRTSPMRRAPRPLWRAVPGARCQLAAHSVARCCRHGRGCACGLGADRPSQSAPRVCR